MSVAMVLPNEAIDPVAERVHRVAAAAAPSSVSPRCMPLLLPLLRRYAAHCCSLDTQPAAAHRAAALGRGLHDHGSPVVLDDDRVIGVRGSQ